MGQWTCSVREEIILLYSPNFSPSILIHSCTPPFFISHNYNRSAASYASVLSGRGCSLVHSGVAGTGENLFATYGGAASQSAAVGAWASEGYSGGNSYNHFTQVIWGNTRSVGCATIGGSNCQTVVCHYYP